MLAVGNEGRDDRDLSDANSMCIRIYEDRTSSRLLMSCVVAAADNVKWPQRYLLFSGNGHKMDI